MINAILESKQSQCHFYRTHALNGKKTAIIFYFLEDKVEVVVVVVIVVVRDERVCFVIVVLLENLFFWTNLNGIVETICSLKVFSKSPPVCTGE